MKYSAAFIDGTSPAIAFNEGGAEVPGQLADDCCGRFVGNRLFADGFESGDLTYWVDLDR